MNNKLELFNKGEFKKIDREFIREGSQALIELSKVQQKFGKTDTDTFINELRDSMVGEIMGYHEVNINKHGFDCQSTSGEFLEVKNASFSAQSWQATFNDTTYEKAEAFKSEILFLALAVWDKAADLLFIVYGKNPEIGNYLKLRIDAFKRGETVRSTQSISFTSLINNYGFKIITKLRSKEEVLKIIKRKNPSFGSKISIRDIFFPDEI
jgi:hypothetical protein